MKLSIQLALLLFLSGYANSQSIKKLDSLHHALKEAKNDSVKMDVLGELND